jgi:hypothetical protein
MRLKEQLKALLVSGLVAEVTALFFSVVTQAATREVSPVAFGLFGVVTLALAHRWVLVDATMPSRLRSRRAMYFWRAHRRTSSTSIARFQDGGSSCCMFSCTRS